METNSSLTRRRSFVRLLLTVAAAAALMLPAAAAQAHDVLESTNPADGSTVAAMPAKIELTFDHTPIALGSQMLVKDSTGANQADGPVSIVDNVVTQTLKPAAPAGRYTVLWRVVSSDSHPIEGTFTFTASGPAAGSASAGSEAATAPAAAAPATEPAESARNSTGIPVVVLIITAAVIVLALTAGLVIFTRRQLNRPDRTG